MGDLLSLLVYRLLLQWHYLRVTRPLVNRNNTCINNSRQPMGRAPTERHYSLTQHRQRMSLLMLTPATCRHQLHHLHLPSEDPCIPSQYRWKCLPVHRILVSNAVPCAEILLAEPSSSKIASTHPSTLRSCKICFATRRNYLTTSLHESYRSHRSRPFTHTQLCTVNLRYLIMDLERILYTHCKAHLLHRLMCAKPGVYHLEDHPSTHHRLLRYRRQILQGP